MKDTKFFNYLAIQSGVSDIKTVRLFYYALVRTLYKILKEDNFAEMPDWGKYEIKPYKARKHYDIESGGFKDVPAVNTIRFKADRKLKAKIKNL
jgi:nucleoid DNA-binding protein